MGPMGPFLLGYRDTHFVALRHSMTTCIPRVDGLSTVPPGQGVTLMIENRGEMSNSL